MLSKWARQADGATAQVQLRGLRAGDRAPDERDRSHLPRLGVEVRALGRLPQPSRARQPAGAVERRRQATCARARRRARAFSRVPAARHHRAARAHAGPRRPALPPAQRVVPRPSASFSATLRVQLDDRPGAFAALARAIGDAGGSLGAIDLVRIERGRKVRDVTVDAASADHMDEIVAAVRAVPGVEVERVSDRVFLLHLGGKIEMASKSPLKTRDDLSMAYTPGVARVCLAIADDPPSVWNLTIKKNTVAVVTDGTAVLGLGDIGPAAAMPVMEGKAMLFKEFGGINAFPICLSTKDPDEIVRTVKLIATAFGGINLEDISAPRCFEIEDRLKAELDIPVFHDDQHGTAVVVLAALTNALKIVGKHVGDIKVVVSGVGAAGVACTKIVMAAGVRNVIGCDSTGAIYRGRTDHMNWQKTWYAEHTNP